MDYLSGKISIACWCFFKGYSGVTYNNHSIKYKKYMKNWIITLVLACTCLQLSYHADAKIKLPALFTDNMVLQQKTKAPVWGWATPGEKIIVTGSWNNQST